MRPSGDDGRVRFAWLLVGRWDRALPELREIPADRARRTWERADEWAWRDPWVRWPRVILWVAIAIAWVIWMMFAARTLARLNWLLTFVSWPLFLHGGQWIVGRLTLSRVRKHVRLEIGTFCFECGYDLRGGHLDSRRGLADPKTGLFRCPECGTALRRVQREVPDCD